MAEVTLPNERFEPVLVFERRRSVAIWMIPAGLVAMTVVAACSGSTVAGGSAVLWLLLACMFVSIASRRTSVHIDLRTRRLKILQRILGRPAKTTVDCPLAECRVLGRIEYETEGHFSYGVYVELLSGRRHDIPVREPTIQEAGRVAAQLAEATGIPRLDTRF